MYKRIMIVAGLCCLFHVPAFADVSHEQIERHFREQAERAGIQTTGKELQEIRRALHEWKEDKRQETILQTAQRYGIPHKGKETHQVIAEVRAARAQRLLQAARQAGISVEGKTMRELVGELEAHIKPK